MWPPLLLPGAAGCGVDLPPCWCVCLLFFEDLATTTATSTVTTATTTTKTSTTVATTTATFVLTITELLHPSPVVLHRCANCSGHVRHYKCTASAKVRVPTLRSARKWNVVAWNAFT